MKPQSIWILLSCILVLAVAGCKKGKQYPTAPAPPTIKDPPPKPMKVAKGSDDDDLDDDDDDDDEGPAPRTGSGSRQNLSPSTNHGGAMVAAKPRPGRVQTINGHPKGPKAEVFNAVTTNAMSNAAPCFAKHVSGGRTVSVVVRMTVGNSGSVESVVPVSGDQDASLRKCVCDVVKRLTFPAFGGPKVSKNIPFTAVGSSR